MVGPIKRLNYALEVVSITCFRQQLFYLTDLNSTPEIKPSLSVATVVVQYSKLLQPFLPPPLLGKSVA